VRGLDAEVTRFNLIDRRLRGEIRCPLPHRRRAAFTEAALNGLQALCDGRSPPLT
jgi:hypothetical protein